MSRRTRKRKRGTRLQQNKEEGTMKHTFFLTLVSLVLSPSFSSSSIFDLRMIVFHSSNTSSMSYDTSLSLSNQRFTEASCTCRFSASRSTA
ncbi:hypothetical protein PanWU01x14_187190 [Parasponia andersonii]|uniref:Uncharacterized protein n=1 Tax=Parasponia andersonii TaxID=3476 RepID=A0A2P5C3R0_PARAD|nr:hypothetical protein PanWU01x14_187190 [Parasponia andersonii]